MPIEVHLTELARMPVDDYRPGAGLPGASEVAWRLRWPGEGDPFLESQLRPFLDEADVASVRALVIGSWTDGGDIAGSGPLLAELAEQAERLPGLEALFLGDITHQERPISEIHHGDVTLLAEAFPALTELVVRGGSEEMTVRPLASGRLRRLTFESAWLPVSAVTAVAASDLPNLEHLELWLGTDEYGGDAEVADLEPILSGKRFPALRRLGLRNAAIADDVATALAWAPVARQVEALDLSLGTLGDDGALALLRGQPLPQVTALDLHHHYLSDAGMAHVRASGLNVDLNDRQDEEDGRRRVAIDV